MSKFIKLVKIPKLVPFVLLISTILTGVGVSVAHADGGSTVSGSLSMGSNPTPSAYVIYNASDGSNGQGETDSNGNYSISVPPGIYSLYIDDTGQYGENRGDMYEYQLYQSSAGINLSSGDVTQNLELETTTINVTVLDSYGNPVANANVIATDSTGGTTYLYAGDPGEELDDVISGSGDGNDSGITNASGQSTLTTIVGATYGAGSTGNSICTTISGEQVCLASPLTVTGTTNIVLQIPPSSPTDLTATTSPTSPTLTWTGVTGATSYNIYRQNVEIGSSTTDSYTDVIGVYT
jgi:hypothetical protein